MKRELKAQAAGLRGRRHHNIARPIPMKRELKEVAARAARAARKNCKAHPDEKGTERFEGFDGVVRLLDELQGPSR